jgi:hypothetical protein
LGDSFKFEDFATDPELEDLGTPIHEPYGDKEDGPRFVLYADDVDEEVTHDRYALRYRC